MTIKERFRFFIYYTIPHFFNKHFGKYQISEKGYEFFDFCMKVVNNPEYEAETYQEIIFEEPLKTLQEKDELSRREAAMVYIRILVPYLKK